MILELKSEAVRSRTQIVVHWLFTSKIMSVDVILIGAYC